MVAGWMSTACRGRGAGVGHCRTACGGDDRGVKKVCKGPNRDELFLPLAMAVVSATDAYEEAPYPYNTRVSLPPLPHPRAWEVLDRSPALDIARPHITLPQEEP